LGSGETTGARFLCAMATFTGGLVRARELLVERFDPAVAPRQPLERSLTPAKR